MAEEKKVVAPLPAVLYGKWYDADPESDEHYMNTDEELECLADDEEEMIGTYKLVAVQRVKKVVETKIVTSDAAPL